jgi:N-methylhydantoinase A
MASRIGIDIGGTFTDLIYFDDDTADVRVAKVASTPAAPEHGVVHALHEAVPAERIPVLRYFIHGTTVGLNALLTRTGATVGLLTTRGFRDVLEIRRGDRTDPYDLFCREPAPLVPRRLRLEVTERMTYDGQVWTPLVEADVAPAVERFLAEGVDSVAVVLLHGYANPTHELRVAELMREAGFEGEISLSHLVTGEHREYQRTTTTVIDAYVRPRTARYLGALATELDAAGFTGSPLVTRSGGGALTFREACERPFETIMSGPVAGAEGAGKLVRELDLGDAITADVGGTSFDTALITGGRPQLQYEGTVEGLPVQAPWIDVRSIGAGGGSIAHVDVGGLLRVGPQSAGAEPGPACYARGGSDPTVTDAACLLGMFGHGELASGLRLDVEAARRAFAPLAQALRLDVEEAARGVLRLASASMADAIREITVEQGIDPRDCALIPFGGAGPLFGTLLADDLEMGDIVVPPHAGNFSAVGLLGADLTQTAARTRIMVLDDAAVAQASATAEALFAELERRVGTGGWEAATPELSLSMRYFGQEHSITVPVALAGHRIAAGAAEIADAFQTGYERAYAHRLDERIEVVSVRATLRGALPPLRTSPAGPVTGDRAARPPVLAWSFRAQSWRDFAVVERAAIDGVVRGPAILTEVTTTTYLDEDFEARIDPATRALRISRCSVASTRSATGDHVSVGE